ncbi:uncharacterized protein LOC106075842 [Biomphalaria glabrata]|uniref:Uncharacterized protein LOC106075842 n=3 Tax=Biomphalaria glabrata TaxID=6526 RepID=A0A9W2YPB6_BIOGL|nr:uncharacterized protein LOC106075842 [Biomphalaria glabrata]
MKKEILSFGLALVMLALTDGQTPTPNAQMVCSNKFETTVGPECFDANGVPFSGVIYILSNNRTGSLPPQTSFTDFINSICLLANQDKTIPCVLSKMQQINATQCTQEDRMLLMGKGSQLLGFMEGVCGKPCETEALQSLAQCFAVIQVSPDPILGVNASIIDDKYTVVGANESEYTKFCSNRNKLFSCLGPLSSTCPSLLDKFNLLGIDLTGFEALSSVLCSDKDKYIKGLTCFKTQTPAITTCNTQSMNNMRTVWMNRFVTGTIAPSKYLGKLCEVKLTQMDCELQAFQKSCDTLTELKTVAECTMLPKFCKENAPYQKVYDGMCQKVTTPASVTTVRPTLSPLAPGTVSPRSGTMTGTNSVSGLDVSLAILIAVTGLRTIFV